MSLTRLMQWQSSTFTVEVQWMKSDSDIRLLVFLSIALFLFQLKIRNFQTAWAKPIRLRKKKFTSVAVLCHFFKKKGRMKEFIIIINCCFSCLMQWKYWKVKVLRLFPTLFKIASQPKFINSVYFWIPSQIFTLEIWCSQRIDIFDPFCLKILRYLL